MFNHSELHSTSGELINCQDLSFRLGSRTTDSLTNGSQDSNFINNKPKFINQDVEAQLLSGLDTLLTAARTVSSGYVLTKPSKIEEIFQGSIPIVFLRLVQVKNAHRV